MGKIYCFVDSGKGTEFQFVVALAEDGHCLAEHCSSCREWARHDIGIISNWKHEYYKEHYPERYELIWLDDPENDEGFKIAAKRNKELGEEAKLAEEKQFSIKIE